NLFPPLDNPELIIRRRSRTNPTLLNNSEMAAEGPSDLPVPDLRTMEELCQPSLNGRGGHISPIVIQATNFGLNNDMIQQLLQTVKLVVVLIPSPIVQPPLARLKMYMLRERIKEDLKGITTRSGTAYQGPTIPNTFSSSRVIKRETEATKDTVHPTNNESTEDVQPPVVPTEYLILNSEPVISLIIEPVASPFSAPRPNQRPSIPYPSRLFVDSLILMPKFSPSIKSLLTNKDKLCELARSPLNKHCSTVLLKKLPEKLGDPGKFLILCDFPGMAERLALADLGASINLMPLSVWNKLSLLDLSPTYMTLVLADRLISHPVGVAEYVFVKVGTFHFSANFVVIDFDADPRVPLILRRSFLMTGRALIDVLEGELTLRVGKEVITFNLDQTLRYSAN
nr:reverse transcriptase domain-containing protein [Tanacetum cinerariifolium]